MHKLFFWAFIALSASCADTDESQSIDTASYQGSQIIIYQLPEFDGCFSAHVYRDAAQTYIEFRREIDYDTYCY